MTRRFEGAITAPEDDRDSTSLPLVNRPARPVSIEASAAILIVGGLVAFVGTAGAAVGRDPAAADPGARPILALIVALNGLTVIVGLLVRRGRAWIACVNVVAVVLFVELMAVPGGSATAPAIAVIDAFVFVALLRNRAWFDWRPPGDVPAR